MKTESMIKQGFLETQHSHRYGELRRIREATCFDMISVCNRLSNALCGLNSGTINSLLNIEMQGGIAGAYARGLLVKEDIIEYNEPVYLPNIMVNKNAEIFKLEQENKYFKVYPNPASDYIYVEYELPEESQNSLIKILSINGKLEKTIELKYNIDNKLIKLGNLSSGTYIFVLETNGKTVDSTNITIAK